NDFSISLPVDRLSFLLAVATLNGERLDGEMSEGELVDAFRHVAELSAARLFLFLPRKPQKMIRSLSPRPFRVARPSWRRQILKR
ncbi:chromosome partition protein MukF, partial [Salmonella enterica subsp. enterica serovar Anatum]|nr:chromosome partition protein MukF [Salmonella enterica subsp. enterica serovar Anatum]